MVGQRQCLNISCVRHIFNLKYFLTPFCPIIRSSKLCIFQLTIWKMSKKTLSPHSQKCYDSLGVGGHWTSDFPGPTGHLTVTSLRNNIVWNTRGLDQNPASNEWIWLSIYPSKLFKAQLLDNCYYRICFHKKFKLRAAPESVLISAMELANYN